MPDNALVVPKGATVSVGGLSELEFEVICENLKANVPQRPQRRTAEVREEWILGRWLEDREAHGYPRPATIRRPPVDPPDLLIDDCAVEISTIADEELEAGRSRLARAKPGSLLETGPGGGIRGPNEALHGRGFAATELEEAWAGHAAHRIVEKSGAVDRYSTPSATKKLVLYDSFRQPGMDREAAVGALHEKLKGIHVPFESVDVVHDSDTWLDVLGGCELLQR